LAHLTVAMSAAKARSVMRRGAAMVSGGQHLADSASWHAGCVSVDPDPSQAPDDKNPTKEREPMKSQRKQRKIVAVAMCAALTFGLAGGAYAQQASGVTGGTTTDQTSAGNANGGGLPQIQQQGDVSYVSGGVGQDESKALQHAQSQWPLSLRFTGPGSDFLADIHVRVVDAHSKEVLSATSRGPYMLVKMRPGRYTVHAQYKDHDQSKTVTIPAKGTAKAAFYWNMQ
jgi:hypothetical protein